MSMPTNGEKDRRVQWYWKVRPSRGTVELEKSIVLSGRAATFADGPAVEVHEHGSQRCFWIPIDELYRRKSKNRPKGAKRC